eukprot:m.1527913 g.1527913  ORF g.1527913 m.1527913 type:complete len:1172 (+) comp25236_c2_seq6:232-3747(+)
MTCVRKEATKSVLLLICIVANSSGCEYDCRSRSFCGPEPVPRFMETFVGYSGLNPSQATYPKLYFQLSTLDLSSRGITRIALGGLACNLKLTPFNLGAGTVVWDNGTAVQAVNLDHNALSTMPSLAVFELVGIISLRNNSITSLADGYLGDFQEKVDELNINLENNRISTITQQMFSNFEGILLYLNLNHNQISTLPDAAFSMFRGSALHVYLDNNRITDVNGGQFCHDYGSIYLLLSLQGNGIMALNNTIPYMCNVTYLNLYLSDNQFSAVPEAFITSFFGESLILALDNNHITALPPATISSFSAEGIFLLSLCNNRISTVGDGVVQFTGLSVFLLLDSNGMTSLGRIFDGFDDGGTCHVSLYNNSLTSGAVTNSLHSFTSSAATLTLNFTLNNVTVLPEYMLARIATSVALSLFSGVRVILAQNPLRTVPSNAFSCAFAPADEDNYGCYLGPTTIDLSDLTATSLSFPEDNFNFSGWFAAPTSLTVVLKNNNIDKTRFLDSFQGFPGNALNIDISNNSITAFSTTALRDAPFVINVNLSHNAIAVLAQDSFHFSGTVDLAYNRISTIDNGTFWGSGLTAVNVSHNGISSLSDTAFDYTFDLTLLDVSHNTLTTLTSGLLSGLPALKTFRIYHNAIAALPLISNHIGRVPAASAGNVLRCAVFGPVLQGCTCSAGTVYSEHCGYGRCLPTHSGCPNTTRFSTASCALAPFSECIAACPPNEYFNTVTRTCTAFLNCSAAFRRRAATAVGATIYVPAYEYEAPTTTSDRQCSICSQCDAGYHTTRCTATSNTRCARQRHLGAGAVVAITLAVVLLAASTVVLGWYGRSQWHRSKHASFALEQTELLLGDVTEKHERMQQAWKISESAIDLRKQLASGSYGTVWFGQWGHIDVAVKRLRIALDFDIDPMAAEDFEREVRFMQEIKHPNLLTLYGAGSTTDGFAFLVMEYMALGSLAALLSDAARALPWSHRLTFAADIARGMQHLHSIGIIHRDLKSENCLVNDRLHVKVADFGTSRFMASQVHKVPHRPGGVPPETDFGARTTHALMTKAVGTLLWMAPELLSDDTATYNQAIDVYSYGVVLWEIWSRVLPFEELNSSNSYIEFYEHFRTEVCGGHRPPVPPHDADPDAPPFYADLVQRCWSGVPLSRPSFSGVLQTLEGDARSYSNTWR